jgi:1-deoxy-D-xylulose-5-phosphate reductoisomerase
MDKLKNIVILGSTGSIGTNTLNVLQQHKNIYNVYALVANTQVDKLIQQCIDFKPKFVILIDKTKHEYLKQQLEQHKVHSIILDSEQDIIEIVTTKEVDIVMSAIVGAKGLLPTYYAIKANKKVLLANKESLIIGGNILISTLKSSQSQIIPVDSEHSAIFQALQSNNFNYNEVNRIILTASGGPFYNYTDEQLQNVTVNDALNHPNWKMGKKITIDSSTLMNKGFEVIEAYWLFGQNINLIDVIIHPESIIHSMVEFIDGSILAQMGLPDMRTAIAYAINYPNRLKLDIPKLNLNTTNNLTFKSVNYNKFPCLKLAFDVIKTNPNLSTIMNAANEIAVNAFLNGEISYLNIYKVINKTMDTIYLPDIRNIEDIIALDFEARQTAFSIVSSI